MIPLNAAGGAPGGTPPQVVCSSGGETVDLSVACDGNSNCADSSDETLDICACKFNILILFACIIILNVNLNLFLKFNVKN